MSVQSDSIWYDIMLACKTVAILIFIFSGTETSHALDGVFIHENENDVELYHLSHSICQNNFTGNTTNLLSSKYPGFCGFQCQSDQNKLSSAYYHQSEASSSTCKDDSNILLENGKFLLAFPLYSWFQQTLLFSSE